MGGHGVQRISGQNKNTDVIRVGTVNARIILGKVKLEMVARRKIDILCTRNPASWRRL